MLSVAGGPDLTFGNGGYSSVTASLLVPFNQYDSTASVLQPNGDLVVVGEYTEGGVGVLSSSISSFYALRYNIDGTLDPNFNISTLTGLASLQVKRKEISPTPVYTGATGVVLETDGQIVVSGEVNGVAKVIQLNPNGTLDTSFGTGGIVTLGSVGNSETLLDYASSVALLPGGLIAVGGAVEQTPGQDSPAVEALNADGSIDTSYGTGGLAVAPLPANGREFIPIAPTLDSLGDSAAGPFSMVAEPNGDVVVVANATQAANAASTEIVASRFGSDGILDNTFGAGNQVTITPQSILPSGSDLLGTAVASQSNGDLVIGGSYTGVGPVSYSLALRLSTSGTFDSNFGIGGFNILPPATPVSESVGAIAIQPDGKIVLADRDSNDYTRLNSNGSLDISFGNLGTAIIEKSVPTLQGESIGLNEVFSGTVGLAITAGGKILAAEDDGDGTIRLLLGQGSSGDYDGDGISDRAIYLTSTGSFAYTPSSGRIGPIIQFGPAGPGQSLPAPGAYGGEGIDELAVYIPALGDFAIKPLNGDGPILAPFGMSGSGNSLPAPGDYDDSGATELAVYLPTLGVYAYRPANGGADVVTLIGVSGPGNSIPVPADYFGTGQDDVAVYEPARASYVIRNPSNGQIYTVPFGMPGAGNSIPVPGDYDGSGHDDLAVYIPSLAELIYRPADGGPNVTVPFGKPGTGNTLPAPGDYDGSGKTDVAAYLPTLGIFAYRPTTGGGDQYDSIGIPNQTIPFELASATNSSGSGLSISAESFSTSASVDIPLTADVLDSLAETHAKKKAGQA